MQKSSLQSQGIDGWVRGEAVTISSLVPLLPYSLLPFPQTCGVPNRFPSIPPHPMPCSIRERVTASG